MSKFYIKNKCFHRFVTNYMRFESKRHFFWSNKRDKTIEGLYVLFPDIPSDTESTNELLRLPTEDSLTKFSQLNPEKCVKAVGKLSIDFESRIDAIERQFDEKKLSLSLDEVIQQIEEPLVRLNFGLSTFRTLRNVDKKRYQFKHFDDFFERINGVKVRRFQSKQIYYFMREINSNANQLNNCQKRVVNKYLLESKLFGTHLPSNELNALNTVHNSLSEEMTLYRNRLLESTKRFSHTIDDPSLLQVLPDELIASIGSHSNATVTLHSSVFNPFMEYCPDRLLRWNLWVAYNSRSSPSTDTKLSNSIIIENIRSLRRKQAQVLGYETYVDQSMETKMANNLDNVKTFINTLNTRSKSAFDSNLKELTDFAQQSGSFEGDKLELWDLPYWQRKLLRAKYSIDDSAIKQYFPLKAVLNGMFQLAEDLFDLKIEEVLDSGFDFWHKDVQLFRIISRTKGTVALFLFDPYSRLNNKSSGYRNESALSGCHSLNVKPISYWITNLPKPLIKGHSTQLSFAQIIPLFKQFGHILQHSLSEIQYSEISGLSNLEWDVVHFCPEFFALWPLNSYRVIASCSSHVLDGRPIPEEDFDKIRRAHNHFSSINLKHEIYRMALDLALYSSTEFWGNIRDQVWDEYMTPFTRDKLDAHPCSFRTIFCDDFAAAYFSFKWAEMLASDAFGAFQEVGLNNQPAVSQVGARFKDTFLTLSGGFNSNELFRRFLGRDPSPDAFLRINGLYGHHKKEGLGPERVETTAERRIN